MDFRRSTLFPSRGAPCEGEPLGPEFAPEAQVYGPQWRRTRETREVRSRRGAAEVFREAIEYVLAEEIESVLSTFRHHAGADIHGCK